jgi:hypothetical protein
MPLSTLWALPGGSLGRRPQARSSLLCSRIRRYRLRLRARTSEDMSLPCIRLGPAAEFAAEDVLEHRANAQAASRGRTTSTVRQHRSHLNPGSCSFRAYGTVLVSPQAQYLIRYVIPPDTPVACGCRSPIGLSRAGTAMLAVAALGSCATDGGGMVDVRRARSA